MPQFQLATAYRPPRPRQPVTRRAVSQLERAHMAGALSVVMEQPCPHCGARSVRERAVKAIEPEAIAAMREDLAGASPDLFAFFDAVWAPMPGPQRLRQLMQLLGMEGTPVTLLSRFLRAGLPSPKRYMSEALLVRAAHLLTFYPATALSTVANVLEQPSPQGFCRFIRSRTGMSGVEFRRAFDGPARLDVFRETLILPYRDALLAFRPIPSKVAIQ